MASKAPATVAESIVRLRLFNEKAEKLQRCSFVQKVFGSETGVTISFGVDQPLIVERKGADEEATDALSLTLRFFLNDRDGISLEQIRQLHAALPLSHEQKEKSREAFQRQDRFLDAEVGVVFQGEHLTNRVIIETVLYGSLAHTNSDKRRRFQEWQASLSFGAIIESLYEEAVANLVQFIVLCQRFHEEIIRCLV